MVSSILDLTQSINNLKYIGEQTAKKLNQINIYSAVDLLLYFPINTEIRNFCNVVQDIKINNINVLEVTPLNYVKSHKKTTVYCEDNKGNPINVILFKIFPNYLEKYFPLNQKIIILSEAYLYNNQFAFYHPKQIYKSNKLLSDIKPIIPVYKQHQNITSNQFHKYINQALNILKNCDLKEWIDNLFLDKHQLPSFKEALLKIHNPEQEDDISSNSIYRRRIAIDEILNYHIALINSRENINKQSKTIISNNTMTNTFLKQLPFKLTNDQIIATKFIKEQISKNIQTTSLIQGDVGSGKTVVCFLAAIFALENNYQVALMAPTEILATQHYNNFKTYAKNLNIKIELLKSKAKNKKDIKNKIQLGDVDIVIGTHALFQDNVEFKKLALVIIDEQHKFGVQQRLKLLKKGNNPHLLLTTATPIPRTLSLALYGDINSFQIKEKPSNRQPIITTLKSHNKMEEVLNAVSRALKNNQKIYWVCPLIEESEKLQNLTSSKSRYQELKNYFSNYDIYLLHGALKNEEKQNIMNNFKENSKPSILVSTTVIEVGVDIPKCNIMIIENADKYSLSQLHQLRGRVGRGQENGYCILVYSEHISESAKKRLLIIKNSLDGFYISEKDLEMRGIGEILGSKQSGFNIFKTVDLENHSNLLVSLIPQAKIMLNKANQTKESLSALNQLKSIFSYSYEYINKLG